MGKNIQNLSEEINRIKSLFSEDRLWGNLIEQTDDECIDQLEDSGYIVSNPASPENNLTRQHLIGCLYRGGNKSYPTPLYNIYEKIKDETTNIKIEIRERGDNCMLLFKNKVGCMGDQLYGSIWEDSGWNIQILYALNTPIVPSNMPNNLKILVPALSSVGISFLGWEGMMNNLTLDYNNLEFRGLYNANGGHIPGSGTLKGNQMKSYIDKNESDGDGDGLDDSTGNPLNHPIYEDFLTEQSGIPTPIGKFIDNILKRGSGLCITGIAPWKRK